MNAEVVVTFEVVGEESDPDGVSDQSSRDHQVRFLFRSEESASGFHIASREFLEERHFKLDAIEIGFVLGGAAGGGSHHVAEVVKHESRHDCIQVHDTHCLARFVVEHHVVELRVIVRDTLGNFATGVRREQYVHHGLLIESESNLAGCNFAALDLIAFDRGFQPFKPLSGVVEVRDGDRKILCGQIAEQALEVSECESGLIRLGRGFSGFKGFHSFDKKERAPETIVGVDVEGMSIAGSDHAQRSSVEVGRSFLAESTAQMLSHLENISHQWDGFLEHTGVESLMDVANVLGIDDVRDSKGFIDVPDLNPMGFFELAINLEVLSDFLQLRALVCVHLFKNSMIHDLTGEAPMRSQWSSETLTHQPWGSSLEIMVTFFLAVAPGAS